MSRLKRLNIELSAICNYGCESCPNTYMEREKGHMSLDLFTKIFDQVDSKVDEIFLWNYGESLLNPKIEQILSHINNSESRTILSTTGAPLDKIKDFSLLSNLDELIISINGLDQETYSFHQKNGNLQKVLSGLNKIKGVMDSSNTDYVMQFVVNSKNISQLGQLEEFAANYGFKRLDVKTFNVMDNKPETFKKFVPKDGAFSRYTLKIQNSKIADPCLNWIVINWNGNINPCCWDYEGEIILGNAADSTIEEIWNSETVRLHREKMKSNSHYEICKNCGKEGTLIYRKRLK